MGRARWLALSAEDFDAFTQMPAERRYAVMERAAIIHEACGCTWEVADKRALDEERQTRRAVAT